jgi:hypothetical protein
MLTKWADLEAMGHTGEEPSFNPYILVFIVRKECRHGLSLNIVTEKGGGMDVTKHVVENRQSSANLGCSR